MKPSETVARIREVLELFPRCAKCGEILDPNRLTLLVQVVDRPNRYAHRECPKAAA